jgi:hypothetical protein
MIKTNSNIYSYKFKECNMFNKMLSILAVVFTLGIIITTQAQTAYTFNGGAFRYGTINLTTGVFTSLNFMPQGSSHYPATADNDEVDAQYAIISDFSFPPNYYLWHINFNTLTGDSIATVGPLASGQNVIKGMGYNVLTDNWYVVSGNDFGSAAYLYTLNITTGALTVVGQIQNADLPVAMAIDCDGNAYLVNVVFGASSIAVLNSLNLSTAAATAIGTDLGLADVTGFSQDMDFDPDNGNLYWSGYWASGFFSEGGSFRLVDVTTGTSTEISAFGQFETITGFNVNGICATVPVELESFTAIVNNNNVLLQWSTATETNNSGFNIERKSSLSDWETIGFVTGFGTTTEPRSYSYNDAYLNAGSYVYRLKQVDYDGSFEYSDIVEVVTNSPVEYTLDQNYPNPFNPATKIRFTISELRFAILKVYDVLGNEIAILVNEELPAGEYEVEFDASLYNLSSGFYFVRMEAGSFTTTRKITLMK